MKNLKKSSGNELMETRAAVNKVLTILQRDFCHVDEYTQTIINAAEILSAAIEKEINRREE